MLHVKLDTNAAADLRVAAGSNVIVHAIAGSGTLNGHAIGTHQAGILSSAPESVRPDAQKDGFEALFLAGMPLHEPVARYGPFLMTTERELQKAFDDYRSGNFGEIARGGA